MTKQSSGSNVVSVTNLHILKVKLNYETKILYFKKYIFFNIVIEDHVKKFLDICGQISLKFHHLNLIIKLFNYVHIDINNRENCFFVEMDVYTIRTCSHS